MYLGNGLLLLLNLPLIGIWVRVLKVPYRILFPLILLFCLIGAYSVKNTTFDLFLVIFFGAVGYLMRKFESAVPWFAFLLLLSNIIPFIKKHPQEYEKFEE